MVRSRLFEDCAYVTVSNVPDGRGGMDTVFSVSDGSFMAAFARSKSTEEGAGGPRSASFYNVMTGKDAALSYGGIYFRRGTGEFFRVTSEPVEAGAGSRLGFMMSAVVIKKLGEVV